MTCTMNKRLISSNTGSFNLEIIDIPEAPHNGMVVKVHYTGICHSDASMFYSKECKMFLPKVYGHEISGTIHTLGKGYTPGKLAVGDRVVVYPWCGCRKCDNCLVDDTNICSNRFKSGAEMYGVWKDGGYQTYIEVESTWGVIPVPDKVDLSVAALVPCGALTAYNAVVECKDSIVRAIRASGQANVLIMGTGGLGLWAIQIVKAIHGESVKVLATDINEVKLDGAKQSGADELLLSTEKGNAEEIAEQIKSCFHGEGVDASFDFVNNTDTFERIFHSLNMQLENVWGGTAALVGISHGQKLPQIEIMQLVFKKIRIQAIHDGPKKHTNEIFKLLIDGKIKGPKIDFVSLIDVESVLQKMVNGTLLSGRAVVNMCAEK